MRRLGLIVVLVLVVSGCQVPWLELASRDLAGGPAAGDSTDPALSADGRYVAFTSSADDLVPGDTNGVDDIFVRDLQTGTTEIVSLGVGGVPADGRSWSPSISADGRRVAFSSSASNLAPHVAGRDDVFVRDRSSDTTVGASAGFDLPGQTGVGTAAISGDGTKVWFSAAAEVIGVVGHALLIYDVPAGSLGSIAAPQPFPFLLDGLDHGSVSGDGRYAAVSMFTFPMPVVTRQVYRVDGLLGTSSAVPEHTSATPATPCWSPSISADGPRMAFVCATDTIIAGTSTTPNVYARDLSAGSTSRVSLDSLGGDPNGSSLLPSLSADGTNVVFVSYATDLVAGDGNGSADVFVRDLVASTTSRVSLDLVEVAGNHSKPSLGGALVAFTSDSDDLVSGDGNGTTDVFVRSVSVPRVLAAAPALVAPGSTTSVTLTGSGFRSDAVVQFPAASGVTVDSVVFVSPTQVTIYLTVAPSAAAGTRQVTVLIPGPGPGVFGRLGSVDDCTCVTVS